jgi:hypothetical protein
MALKFVADVFMGRLLFFLFRERLDHRPICDACACGRKTESRRRSRRRFLTTEQIAAIRQRISRRKRQITERGETDLGEIEPQAER